MCAVVVTFHPDDVARANLATLCRQVRGVVVVDNGSDPAELEALRQASVMFDFELVANGENLGIATALNIGVRRAQALGAVWVFLFDQDSCMTDGFVETMIEGFGGSSWGEQLAILVPRYVDKRLGTTIPSVTLAGGGLETAITSGSLLRMETFSRHGLFLDELFIDGVDYEYSLRVRRAGGVIEECPRAVLLHSPGEPRIHRFRGKRAFQSANYSPIRRYYQERNKVWIAKRYFGQFPAFCFKLFLFSAKDLLKIVLVEEGKATKLLFFLRGVRDGFRERMGPFRL